MSERKIAKGTRVAGITKDGKQVFGKFVGRVNGRFLIAVKYDAAVLVDKILAVGDECVTKIAPIQQGKVSMFKENKDGDTVAVLEIDNSHRTRHIKISEML